MSGAASRNRGIRAELEVAHALTRAGWQAITTRSIRGGTQGGEDLVVTDFPYVVEVKDHARLDLPGFWRQATEQAGDDPALVVAKRRGKARAEEWWAISDLATLLRVIGAPKG